MNEVMGYLFAIIGLISLGMWMAGPFDLLVNWWYFQFVPHVMQRLLGKPKRRVTVTLNVPCSPENLQAVAKASSGVLGVKITHVKFMQRNGEHWYFSFRDDQRWEVMKIAEAWASNPELSFGWHDVATLKAKVRPWEIPHPDETTGQNGHESA